MASSDYAMVRPRFWTGSTGSQLRGHPNAQLLGVYLMTCAHRGFTGIYSLPYSYIIEDTGLAAAEIETAMAKLVSVGFAQYDAPTRIVWVTNLAREQVGEELTEGDKRRKRIVAELKSLRGCPFRDQFLSLYASPWGLESLVDNPQTKGHSHIQDAPCNKGLDQICSVVDLPPDLSSSGSEAPPIPPKRHPLEIFETAWFEETGTPASGNVDAKRFAVERCTVAAGGDLEGYLRVHCRAFREVVTFLVEARRNGKLRYEPPRLTVENFCGYGGANGRAPPDYLPVCIGWVAGIKPALDRPIGPESVMNEASQKKLRKMF